MGTCLQTAANPGGTLPTATPATSQLNLGNGYYDAPTTFFSGYSNGVHNYMPVSSAYEEGGYEVWMTPFAPEAAGITVEKSLELLRELRDAA